MSTSVLIRATMENQGHLHREQIERRDAGRSVLSHLAGQRGRASEAEWRARIERGEVRLDGERAAPEQRLGASFPMGLDTDGGAQKAWGAYALPVHFWIDKDGIVRYMQVVPEITELPDMAAAMAAAKALL